MKGPSAKGRLRTTW